MFSSKKVVEAYLKEHGLEVPDEEFVRLCDVARRSNLQSRGVLKRLIDYCCSSRRYEVRNPYLVDEIRYAINWVYGEEFVRYNELHKEGSSG